MESKFFGTPDIWAKEQKFAVDFKTIEEKVLSHSIKYGMVDKNGDIFTNGVFDQWEADLKSQKDVMAKLHAEYQKAYDDFFAYYNPWSEVRRPRNRYSDDPNGR